MASEKEKEMPDEANYLQHTPGWLSLAALAISGFFAKGYIGKINTLEDAQKLLQTREEAQNGRAELRDDIAKLAQRVDDKLSDIHQSLLTLSSGGSQPPRRRRRR